MNMSITYWLNCEDKDRCLQIRLRGTVFEKEPAYITAYDVCKGLNEYYSNGKKNIPLRDAQTGKRFHNLPLTATVDKMIKWLRDKHDIFYFQAINLCIPLEDPLSMRVKRFWEAEDERQKQIEEYCKSDPAVTASEELDSVKKERDELKKKCDALTTHLGVLRTTINSTYGLAESTCGNSGEIGSGGHVCTVCKGRVCDQFIDILNALGIKEGVLYPARGQSKVDAYANAAKVRADIIFSEHQKKQKQIDELYERIHNQEETIKTQNESLTKQRKQLKDLGASLRDIKEVVDCEMDDLMKTHGDDIIPIF